MLHTLQIVPYPRSPGSAPLALPPLVRSLLLLPLRLPSAMLAAALVYLLCVPGFGLLVGARQRYDLPPPSTFPRPL